jgi:hypothetical protein
VASVNVAVTAVLALTVTVQAAVPVHAPLQPLKVEPVTGVAVKATCVPVATDSEHVVPQAMPAGELVTFPLPVPLFVTDRVAVADAVAVPLTLRDTVSLPTVKITFDANVPVVVGWKRTVAV